MHVLIVDDDALIRKWLTMLLKQIPNRNISVNVAENGIQALESIQNYGLPDLIITDIKMPQMDGLELCQQLKQKFPQIPVAILSAYDEFPLVKKALQFGAIDYILKTDMGFDDISNIIEKAEKSVKEKSGEAVDDLGYAREKKQILEDYLKNGRNDDNTFLLRLNAQLILETATLMMFRSNRNIDSNLEWIADKCPIKITLVPYDGTIYLAFIHNSELPAPSLAQKKTYVACCLKYLRKQDAFSVEVWSTILNCAEIGINASIQTCQDVMDFKSYYSVEDFKQIPYHGPGETAHITQIPTYKRFFEVASRYQVKEATELLWKYLDTLHCAYCHPRDIKQYISVMCHKLLADISMLEISEDWFSSTLRMLHEIEQAPTLVLRANSVERFFEQYNNILATVTPKRSTAVLQVLMYIDDHYAEKITLEEIAAQAHVNRTYMSELFKKEMGVNLNDYINNLRIIHACEYLRFSNYSIDEISERCGFSDQNYFTKVFKKFLNTTPSNYRMDFKQ